MTLAQEKRNVRAWFRAIGYSAGQADRVIRDASRSYAAARRSMRGT